MDHVANRKLTDSPVSPEADRSRFRRCLSAEIWQIWLGKVELDLKPVIKVYRQSSSQRWNSFVRNHARSMLACDFLVVVTARFRVLYVFVLMEIGTRRILHCNVTAHPTAAWTLQQFRETLPGDHGHKFVIHDRDSIFSTELDQQLQSFGVKVLKTPVRAPQANAYCE